MLRSAAAFALRSLVRTRSRDFRPCKCDGHASGDCVKSLRSILHGVVSAEGGSERAFLCLPVPGANERGFVIDNLLQPVHA